jgi:hypothetical protein
MFLCMLVTGRGSPTAHHVGGIPCTMTIPFSYTGDRLFTLRVHFLTQSVLSCSVYTEGLQWVDPPSKKSYKCSKIHRSRMNSVCKLATRPDT